MRNKRKDDFTHAIRRKKNYEEIFGETINAPIHYFSKNKVEKYRSRYCKNPIKEEKYDEKIKSLENDLDLIDEEE